MSCTESRDALRKVVHRDRLWTYHGTTRAYCLKDQPGGRQKCGLEGGVPLPPTLKSNAGTKARRNMSTFARKCENCDFSEKSQNTEKLEKTSPPKVLQFLRF